MKKLEKKLLRNLNPFGVTKVTLQDHQFAVGCIVLVGPRYQYTFESQISRLVQLFIEQCTTWKGDLALGIKYPEC